MNVRLFYVFAFFAVCNFNVKAENYIRIGAQVYIEPGQTKEEIAHYFRVLNENNMTVCRIRMDESHVRKANGEYDFSLYDVAFEEAEKNGIKVFATLFPANVLADANGAGGVGGFKFPESEEHLSSVSNYIEAVVKRYKLHPALMTWVLQNEPGVAGNMPETKFAKKKFEEWRAARASLKQYNNFMQIHYEEAEFMRDFTTWYMKWLSQEVRKIDPKTDLHVNPHMIFSNLADYDFESYQGFLSHIGASMHPSWHFGYFNREDYSLAISANCEIIRTGAGDLPFWVTELQGGNNNFSGYNPLMPTSSEIAQWMWTAIANGTEGIIFWTLNPRAAGFEAGEWALLDFQMQPTERLKMAGEIATLLTDSPGFEEIKPKKSNIYLLYSPESLVLQRNSEMVSNQVRKYYPARKEGAHIKSLLAYYKVFEQKGVGARIYHMDQFDWSCDPRGKTIVLANMAIVPRSYYQQLRSFVKSGGRLLVTGQTAHFDEYVYNVMYGEWTLKSLFGAEIKEFRSREDNFDITVGKHALKGHYLEGIIANETAEIISQNEQGDITGVRNQYGDGEVVWIPSMLGLAYWGNHDFDFSAFLMEYCEPVENDVPFFLSGDNDGILIKNFKGKDGNYSLVINKSGHEEILPYHASEPSGEIIFQLGQSDIVETGLLIKENDCVVVKWP